LIFSIDSWRDCFCWSRILDHSCHSRISGAWLILWIIDYHFGIKQWESSQKNQALAPLVSMWW
jgi:hypothetical protein